MSKEGYQQNLPEAAQNVSRSIIQPNSGIGWLLQHNVLVVERQLEILNVLVGFEQANKYSIHDPFGNQLGYIAEEESGYGDIMSRQCYGNQRSFTAHILDLAGREILRIDRQFVWINSRIRCVNIETGEYIGKVRQTWHMWRRKYKLFLNRNGMWNNFAGINARCLSWDFSAVDREKRQMGLISRDFRGYRRELFTDTGRYVLRFDAASAEMANPPQPTNALPNRAMTLDERAILLAAAVSIDVDYFSTHSQ